VTLDARRRAPATARNREPILGELRSILAGARAVLEIASGTGEHAVHFARNLPHLEWQPSDVDADNLASIEAHRAEAALPNLRAPVRLDVLAPDWSVSGVDAIVCINMIHIAPFACCRALVAGAARLLPAGGSLVLYGPFRFDGVFLAPSNEAFDASLRARDPAWGVRDLADVTALAVAAGLTPGEVIALPANNHLVVFRRA
jgi:hypothetical protein